VFAFALNISESDGRRQPIPKQSGVRRGQLIEHATKNIGQIAGIHCESSGPQHGDVLRKALKQPLKKFGRLVTP
jgi:hypothetical protein